MKLILGLLQGFLVVQLSLCSPFELTDRYIEEFTNGIHDLKKLAETHVFEEGHFDPNLYNETEALKDAEEYDFIIVGAGTSGAVIANRLTEVPEWRVLVLEAGGHETPYTKVPALHSLLQTTPYSWGYTTEKEESYCHGMIDNKCAIASGKALGGSTAINSMVYTRGNPRDYDIWADHGNDGWCYKDVLPYFKKSEDAHLHEFDRTYHSLGGPLHVENLQHETHWGEHFLEAGKELGIPTIDYNGKEQKGFGHPQTTTKSGRRNSVASAYLEPAKVRKNLHVKTDSHVIKIIVKPHTKEAYGVKYIHDGKMFIAKSSKEVILAAGAFNTPQLLMLSGIGPKEELEKLDIHHIQDLKVGHNLKDHVAFIGLNFIYNESLVPEHDHPDEHTNIVNYLRNGKGPLTAIGIEGIGYIKTEASKEKGEYPDVELFFAPKTYASGYDKLKNLRIKKEIYDSLWKPIEGHHGFTIAVMQAQPKSSGFVTLKSKDPFHHPLIHTKQFTDPDDHDITTVLKGIRKAIEISKTAAFQKLGAHINTHQVHGCEQHEFDTDDYWKCAIRHLSISLRHQTGTAKMGPETDKEAVVDHTLKVHGINKLRVADASVIPVSITGHLHAPVVMVGEKAADLIKHHWK